MIFSLVYKIILKKYLVLAFLVIFSEAQNITNGKRKENGYAEQLKKIKTNYLPECFMYTSAECHNKKKQKQIIIIALMIVYFIEVLKEKILLLEDQTVKFEKK